MSRAHTSRPGDFDELRWYGEHLDVAVDRPGGGGPRRFARVDATQTVAVVRRSETSL